jgi:hypothetical protein
MHRKQGATMNDAPRSYLTPADRDAAMIEASRLRALSLRREAFDAAWNAIAEAARSSFRRAAEMLGRVVPHSQKGA